MNIKRDIAANEVKNFYMIFPFVKTTINYIDYLLNGKHVHRNMKVVLKNFRYPLSKFYDTIYGNADHEVRDVFFKEFTEKDFEVFANIHHMLIDLPEVDRLKVEDITTEIHRISQSDKEVKIEINITEK